MFCGITVSMPVNTRRVFTTLYQVCRSRTIRFSGTTLRRCELFFFLCRLFPVWASLVKSSSPHGAGKKKKKTEPADLIHIGCVVQQHPSQIREGLFQNRTENNWVETRSTTQSWGIAMYYNQFKDKLKLLPGYWSVHSRPRQLDCLEFASLESRLSPRGFILYKLQMREAGIYATGSEIITI